MPRGSNLRIQAAIGLWWHRGPPFPASGRSAQTIHRTGLTRREKHATFVNEHSGSCCHTLPAVGLAGISNKEVARQIAQHLKESGKLHHWSISVTYSDGTVLLQGQVASPEQAKIAINLVFQADCVKGVVNELKIVPAQPVVAKDLPPQQSSVPNPLRRASAMNSQDDQGDARRVPASFTPTVAQQVAAAEPVEEAPQPMPMSGVPTKAVSGRCRLP